MTYEPEATLNIQDVPRVITKYWPGILITTLCSTLLFIAASLHAPKKYKTHFVMTITSKYFQSPLIGDFVPELSESGEMRSQRESLIRQVLTPEYLDELGTKYGIYGAGDKSAPDGANGSRFKTWMQDLGLSQTVNAESKLSAQREALRSRIDIFSLNSTTFNIGFSYSDPSVTFKVTNDIYAEIIQSLLEIRMRTLANVRDAIQKRLGSLTVSMTVTPTVAPTAAATDAQVVENELESVRTQIRSLTAEYTEEHPLVIQLRERERILANRLDGMNASNPLVRPEGREKKSAGGEKENATRDIYDDLTKKLNYLNIAIDSDREHQSDYFATLEPPLYPSSSLGPKKGLIAVWGLVLGLFGSLFVAAIKEYFERSTLHADAVAHQLGIPVLGHLPTFPSKTTY